MNTGAYVYKPRRFLFGIICTLVFLLAMGNIYLILESNSIWPYISLVILLGIFVFLFIPLVKNQRIMLSGRKMVLFTFGQKNDIDIVKNLEELVVKNDEIVSYRFDVDGKYFQISPSSYYEESELKSNLEVTLKRYNLKVNVVAV